MNGLLAIRRVRHVLTTAPTNGVYGLRIAAFLMLAAPLLSTGCGAFTDPATRVAFALKAGASRLGSAEGSTYSVHASPARGREGNGSYTVQLDKVGALIVWCNDAACHTAASGSTSYHSRFVTTPRTYIVDKSAGTILAIDLERHNGHAVIVGVQ